MKKWTVGKVMNTTKNWTD